MSNRRASAGEYEIRPLRNQRDLAACVALQSETWGEAYADVVPASMLQVAAKMGGVVTGAFDAQGGLLGFVYGITGLRDGETAHWSHMLAVRKDARDRGIGAALKKSQREELLALGIASVYWTFDPLVARNAHLNINRLGVEVREYVPDFYGASKSELHELGTDRFVVKWNLHQTNKRCREDGIVAAIESDGQDRRAEVLVPSDIDALRSASRETALEWRLSSRRAFLSLFRAGYRVCAFEPGPERARYVLVLRGG